jgi:hypothetical protein
LIGALRVHGRWVSLELLERLSRRSEGPNAPSRAELVEQFCRAAGWRDAKGRLSISAASVALRKLESQAKVQLPPMAPRNKALGTRGLFDDGQALPVLPKLPQTGPIAGWRLRLIVDEHDPAHRIWNRLIVREHPLGRRPLVGAQLRYLVESDLGVIGAFGFGPPAFHLECRDQWIGWSPKARAQNRHLVIGLSRFLIRPGLCRSNLASQSYGLVLAQVAEDWQKRYSIRPVLVETYVDRATHQGRSLAAANWRRLGESKGRGRDDPRREKSKSPKDVWVYELDRQARRRLQAQALEILAPRSVFAPPVEQDWVEEEMAGVELGDQRLNRRIRGMLSDRWKRPGHSFYRSFENSSQCKRAYELVENARPEIHLGSLLAPHQQQTARRMAAEKVVLLAQDTTALSYNTLHQTQGLGFIGKDFTRGLFLHSLQAFRLDGIPLATAWAELWARPEQSDTALRNEQSVADKESGRWVRALQAASERARQMPQTQIIVCGDRESDFYELYDQLQAVPNNVHLLVRGQHDRCLTDGTQLWEALGATPLGGVMKVNVPRSKRSPARVAVLELRWLQVEVKPPAVALKKSWPTLKLYSVFAKEVGAPSAVEPIEWLLLSSWPLQTLKMARRLVRWYALRWGIECWHKVLKVVCGVERRQMKSAQALERVLALDMIVASRVLLLNRLGKEHPDLPADLFYSPDELAVLEVKKKETAKYPSTQNLTVLQANILVAMLAGFWGRDCDGHPGAQVLGEGLRLLHLLTWYQRQCDQANPKQRRRRAPT